MLIEKILKVLKIKFSSTAVLKDGTQLELSGELETGVNVSVITSDGPVALPDGEYQLEDMTILMVKDGLVTDIIKPGQVEEQPEGLDPMGNPTPNQLATQTGNPDVSGMTPTVKEDTSTITGNTTDTTNAASDSGATMPPDDTQNIPDDEMLKIAELESKISTLEQTLNDVMAKLNMISEKFTVATPIVKIKEDNLTVMNPKLQNKVDLIRMLRKNN